LERTTTIAGLGISILTLILTVQPAPSGDYGVSASRRLAVERAAA
jgi:hypothetical protein